MILLFGALSDSGIAYLAHRLLEAKARFLLLDPRQYGTGFQLEWQSDGERFSGHLRHGRHVTPLSRVRSVYVHLLSLPPRPNSSGTSPPAAGRQAAVHSVLHSFLETIPVPVCNRPSAMATNYSKTWQQQIIAAHGFRVPRTLVTNVPADARNFLEECHQRVIYKSLSARRSIVKRLTKSDLPRLEQVHACPTQFQEWIPGVDVRVHVIGDRVFPTEIITEAVDYRYSGREGLPRAMRGVELPESVAGRCCALVRNLGMLIAGVDLRRSLDGEYYCFEVNPTPGFMFYQQYTGQRIGDALAELLRRGRQRASERVRESSGATLLPRRSTVNVRTIPRNWLDPNPPFAHEPERRKARKAAGQALRYDQSL